MRSGGSPHNGSGSVGGAGRAAEQGAAYTVPYAVGHTLLTICGIVIASAPPPH